MRFCVATLILLSMVVFVSFLVWSKKRDPDTLLSAARTALAAGEYDSAIDLGGKLVPDDGEYFVQALLISGEAEQRLMHLDAAAKQYLRIPDNGSKTSQLARYTAGFMITSGTPERC